VQADPTTGALFRPAAATFISGNSLLSTAAAAAAYQPLDADLTSWAALTRASGFDTFTVTPSSANLASLVTGETGSGALVFGTSPTFTTPDIGAATGTSLTLGSHGVISGSSSNINLLPTSVLNIEVNASNGYIQSNRGMIINGAAGHASRSDSGLVIVRDNTHVSMNLHLAANPTYSLPNGEALYNASAIATGGLTRQIYSVSGSFVNPDPTTGFSLVRLGATYSGGTAMNAAIRVFGNQGIAVFGADDTTYPGTGIMTLYNGTLYVQAKALVGAISPATSDTLEVVGTASVTKNGVATVNLTTSNTSNYAQFAAHSTVGGTVDRIVSIGVNGDGVAGTTLGASNAALATIQTATGSGHYPTSLAMLTGSAASILFGTNATLAMSIDGSSQRVSLTSGLTTTSGSQSNLFTGTAGGLRVEGAAATGNGAGSGPGLEAGYSSGSSTSYVQSYNRTSSAFAPLAVTGSTINLTAASGVTTTGSHTVTGSLTVSGGGVTSSHATGGLGYATGAGGAVTQATSRTTGVTLNKVSGAITLVSAAGSTSWQTFTVTNSAVAATDTVIVNQKSGTDLNMIHVTAVGAGSFNISFATTGGTTTEQPVFNFAVIKAVAN
jgi:hypothetical protein